ncbi:MAG TPA: hypothetical protein VFK50_10360 [Sphingomicrobium sp.]|nr:hypothetical protein [Sphingomicrobium sp.]
MSQPAVPTMTEAELAKLGIERVPAFTYRIGGFRYTNLADAVAQARRTPTQ